MGLSAEQRKAHAISVFAREFGGSLEKLHEAVEHMKRIEQKAERLDALLCAMQADMRKFLRPGSGLSNHWFISQIMVHLDGPEQRKAQGGGQ